MNDTEGAGRAPPVALASLPPRDLAARVADAVIARRPPERARWTWEDGLLMAAVDLAGCSSGAPPHRAYAPAAMGRLVDAEGRIEVPRGAAGELQHLQPGVVLAVLYSRSGEERYRGALCALHGELRRHPRTKAGGFWSGRGRPFQMWLDALSAPFHARCAAALGEPEEFDDAVHQLVVMEERARNPSTGLPSHAWDESRRQLWSNPESGRSPTVWTRAVGCFAAAAVDTFEVLPENHHCRPPLSAMIGRLAAALLRWQDPATGLWWQVTDQPGRDGNFAEPTGTCLLAGALAKALRLRCIDDAGIGQAARRAWTGVLSAFVQDDGFGLPRLGGCTPPLFLGGTPYRDGGFSSYAPAAHVTDEPVGIAALIHASVEMDAAGTAGAAGAATARAPGP